MINSTHHVLLSIWTSMEDAHCVMRLMYTQHVVLSKWMSVDELF